MRQERVFVSWSGERSKAIASALKLWLQDVFQGLQVWMSDHDIQAGARWDVEIGKILNESKIGIICLTPESLKSHWLTFEAGALSTAIEQSRVIPYRFGLASSDIAPPLSQFQDVAANEDGTYKLVQSINDAMGNPLEDEGRMKRCFERWWPDLKNRIEAVPKVAPTQIRTDHELLEEVLELSRHVAIRDLNTVLATLLTRPNVRRVEVSPKEIGGAITQRLALRITVVKKLPLAEVPPDQLIPSAIFGMSTDIVEDPSA